MKKKVLFILLMSLVVKVFASDFDDKFTDKKWILEYYNQIVIMQDRDLLLDYIPEYKNQKEILFQRNSLLDECDYWNDEYSETSLIYLLFDSFEVSNIKQLEKDCYEISVIPKVVDNERYKKALENGCDWKQSNIEIKTLFLKFDGDYLYIFLNDSSYLLAIYCAYEKSEYKSLVKFIQTNNSDMSDISLPRHADGTCDYDNSKSSEKTASADQSVPSTTSTPTTNVSVKKLMTTNCNLKLRAAEATSSNVLTVMAQGTKVKILELGKAETIDGISSNWVKVEVQGGAKDRDGKAIAKGLVGWAYGGYLE